jgi:hypothetical protein
MISGAGAFSRGAAESLSRDMLFTIFKQHYHGGQVRPS